MLSRTVVLRVLQRVALGTIATSRSFGGSSFTARSPIATVPPDLLPAPATMRSNVDLPQPDGPTSTQNSPSLMLMSTPVHDLRAAVVLYNLG